MTGLPLPVLRVPPPTHVVEAKRGVLREHLARVLAGVSFPARRWALIIAGEECGTDCLTREALRTLLPGPYPDLDAVVGDVERSFPTLDTHAPTTEQHRTSRPTGNVRRD